MLLQSLVVIAALLVLAASIMTQTLVSAKAELHDAMLARTRTAMADATAAFVAWTQTRVATYGASDATAWPAQASPQQDLAICSQAPPASPAPCPFAVFDSWQIRGATKTGGTTSASPAPDSAEARNLAPTVNEQRIAATITVRITDPSGTRTFADATRDVTARIFEAPPYVVVSGTRDANSQAGSIHAAEGDTAGAAEGGILFGESFGTPNPLRPAATSDTRIKTSVDCDNRPGFMRESFAEPSLAGEIDYSFHPYGNQDWAYESSCMPPSGTPTPPPNVPGYLAPNGLTYSVLPDSSRDKQWETETDNLQSFPR